MGTLVDLTASFHFHHPVSHTNMGLNILRRIRRWLQLFPKRCHKDSQRSNIVFPLEVVPRFPPKHPRSQRRGYPALQRCGHPGSTGPPQRFGIVPPAPYGPEAPPILAAGCSRCEYGWPRSSKPWCRTHRTDFECAFLRSLSFSHLPSQPRRRVVIFSLSIG